VWILAISQFGNDLRVRLHDHPYAPGDACGPECYEYASERTYAAREDRPRDLRDQVTAAAVRALRSSSIGHQHFLDLSGEQLTLLPRG
jgi:hypothetical protein